MQHPEAKEWEKVIARPLFQLYRNTSEKTLWQVRLKASGGYLRRRFNAPSVEKALELAPEIAGIGIPAEERRDRITLLEAFTEALNQSKRRDRAMQDWLNAVEKFLLWLKKRHPTCTKWSVITRAILREYLATYDGKSANYRRLAMQPLLQTSGYMHREYEFPAIGERMGIGSKLAKAPATVYLEDVLSFVDSLKASGSHLEVGVCLQGLAGLQLLEALRLTWTQVDLERGLIEISGEVKNEYRNRVIPVAERVLDALRRANAKRASKTDKIKLVLEPVVIGARGLPYEDDTAYSHQVKAALASWNKDCDWCPKDLRNCLPTFAKMSGVHGTIWEQYIGHAPRNVTDRHYVPRLAARTSGGEKVLEKQMELFRRFVVEPIQMASDPICNNLQLCKSEKEQKAEVVDVSCVV